jgi:hypothetical protein
MSDKLIVENLEPLIAAADAPARALQGVIGSCGPRAVTAVLIAELLARCPVPQIDHEVLVGLDVTHDGELISSTLRLASGQPVTAQNGTDPDAAMTINYELTELLREMYGRTGDRTPVRGLRLATASQDHYPPRELQRPLSEAMTLLLGALSSRPADLGTLAVRYGSDKWGNVHWFTQHYERHFARLRDEPVRLLELGIGGYEHPDQGGGSLRMWRDYFRRGQIFGLDLFPKTDLDGIRLRTLRGDQNDPAWLAKIAEEFGPFDVIVDDGSHINEHVLTSFEALFPHVRAGGFYVIEDLWTSYLPGYGGDDEDLDNPATMLVLIKSLVDALHHEERAPRPGQPTAAEQYLAGLHVYHNIAFLEKGRNAEGRIPEWIPRAPYWL